MYGIMVYEPLSAMHLHQLKAVVKALDLEGKVRLINWNINGAETEQERFERISSILVGSSVSRVLSMGAPLAKEFLKRSSSLELLRFQPIFVPEYNVLCTSTYALGSISYDPMKLKELVKDMEFWKDSRRFPVAKYSPAKPDVSIFRSWKEFVGSGMRDILINPQDHVLSVDIECTGFDFLKDRILAIGIGFSETGVAIIHEDAFDDNMIDFLTRLFARVDITFVYQNGKFDCKFMKSNTKETNICIPTARTDFDTMLAHFCVDETRGTHGLKVWAREEFAAPDWEDEIKQYIPKGGNYGDIPTDILCKYQGYDCMYTRMGYFRFTEKMKREQTYSCFNKVYVPAVKAFTEIELEGIPVDRDRLQQEFDNAQPKIDAAKKKLQAAAIEAGWNPDKYVEVMDEQKLQKWTQENAHLPNEKRAKLPGKTSKPKEFNPNSNPHKAWVGYDLCKMPLFEGKKTSDKHAVDAYKHRHPYWKALAEYKSITDLYGTFIKGMLERIEDDGKIRPDFLLHGTQTGRISCQNPNMQNIPRSSNIKEFFVADENCWVVNADYETLEVVVASILSRDIKMQQPFIEGKNFHSETSRDVFKRELQWLEDFIEKYSTGVDVKSHPFLTFMEKDMMMEIREDVSKYISDLDMDKLFSKVWGHLRFLTKFITFGIMYGRGAQSLAEGELQCSISEAQQYVKLFFARYPKYRDWLGEQERMALKEGYVQNAFGFKRRFSIVSHDNEYKIRNQAWNTPVQGTASMICMSSLCRLQSLLTERKWGRVMFTVHDSIVFSIRKDRIHEALHVIRYEMERWILDIPTEVKLSVDISIGENYKHQKDVVENDRGLWMYAKTEEVIEYEYPEGQI